MVAKKRGPGRPPLPPDQTKPGVFQIRLSHAERAEYQQAADSAKMPLAQWMRDRLSRAAKRERQ